eukprot:g43659.t1
MSGEVGGESYRLVIKPKRLETIGVSPYIPLYAQHWPGQHLLPILNCQGQLRVNHIAGDLELRQQINEAEQHVKKEFDKLHQFLYREEKTALQKLKQERKRKSQLVKRKIDKITEEIAALSFTIQEIQQLLGEEDHIQILRRYPEVEKIYRIKGPTPIPVKAGPIVNVGKAIGSLQYRVWKKMLTVITT